MRISILPWGFGAVFLGAVEPLGGTQQGKPLLGPALALQSACPVSSGYCDTQNC